MSSTTKWILIASVFIVLILGFSTWLILSLKANKIRKTIVQKNFDNVKTNLGAQKALERPGIGEVMKDLQNKFEDPIDDFTMNYLISTIVINQFNTVWYEGKTQGYEILTIAKKTKTSICILKSSIIDIKLFNSLMKEFKIPNGRIKLVEKKLMKDKFDFVIMSEEIKAHNEAFDNIWPNINKKGLLIITNCFKLTRDQKDLIKYLKFIGIRYEHQKIFAGFILVAK